MLQLWIAQVEQSLSRMHTAIMENVSLDAAKKS